MAILLWVVLAILFSRSGWKYWQQEKQRLAYADFFMVPILLWLIIQQFVGSVAMWLFILITSSLTALVLVGVYLGMTARKGL